MRRLGSATLVLVFTVLFAACAHRPPTSGEGAPPALLGTFVDDYGNRFTITPARWTQLPHGRFHVRRWNAAGRYLIARNGAANAHAPNRWTRIDWVDLAPGTPYGWAFCLAAYEAPTEAAAEAAPPSNRETPRTGCNGYPFSRMRRADAPGS